jgi:hypothetical protein
LDAANAVRKNRLLAAIDAKIGPDDSLPAVTNDPLGRRYGQTRPL